MVMTRAPHHLPPEIFPKFLAGRRTMEHQIFGALFTHTLTIFIPMMRTLTITLELSFS
jgi:hypothetical protein